MKYVLPIVSTLLAIVATGLCLFIAHQGGLNRLRKIDTAVALTKGNPEAGYRLIINSGCTGCHSIPGIPGADGRVGPSLEGFSEQATIAGVMQNSSDNLIRWIQHPREVDPKTAMPDLGLTEEQARDVAAYLYAPMH
jgi:cytochrome c